MRKYFIQGKKYEIKHPAVDDYFDDDEGHIQRVEVLEKTNNGYLLRDLGLHYMFTMSNQAVSKLTKFKEI